MLRCCRGHELAGGACVGKKMAEVDNGGRPITMVRLAAVTCCLAVGLHISLSYFHPRLRLPADLSPYVQYIFLSSLTASLTLPVSLFSVVVFSCILVNATF